MLVTQNNISILASIYAGNRLASYNILQACHISLLQLSWYLQPVVQYYQSSSCKYMVCENGLVNTCYVLAKIVRRNGHECAVSVVVLRVDVRHTFLPNPDFLSYTSFFIHLKRCF